MCDGARARLNIGGSGGRDTQNRGKERWGSELPPPYEVGPGGLYEAGYLCYLVKREQREMGTKGTKTTSRSCPRQDPRGKDEEAMSVRERKEFQECANTCDRLVLGLHWHWSGFRACGLAITVLRPEAMSRSRRRAQGARGRRGEVERARARGRGRARARVCGCVGV